MSDRHEHNESALAGCILQGAEKALHATDRFGLTADHFTDNEVRAVFTAAMKLRADGAPLEAWTISTAAGLHISTTQKLIDESPTAATAGYYAVQIRDDHLGRAAMAKLRAAQGKGAVALQAALDDIAAAMPADAAEIQACAAADWLMQPDEAERPIIHGLFDAGDRVTIVGQSKARKSFFALQMAVLIAAGRDFFGAECHPQKVLLVNSEIAAWAYKKRLRRMLKRLEIAPDELAGLTICNTCADAEEPTFEGVLTLAKKIGATLVVLDPIYLYLAAEMDDEGVKASIRQMKKFCTAGITLVSVFHAKKGRMGDTQLIDRITGNGKYARDFSTEFSLCEHASMDDHAVLATVTRNYAPAAPITLAFDHGAFIATDYAPIEKTSSTRTRREIPLADAVKPFPCDRDISYGDAIELLQGKLSVGRNRAVELIGQCRDAGLLFHTKVGRTTFYKPTQAGNVV